MLLSGRDLRFGYDARRRTRHRRRLARRRRQARPSASSARTDRARPRCCGCCRGTRRPRRAASRSTARIVAIVPRRGARAADRGRAAGNVARVRLHRARDRADGPLSAPRRVRGRRTGRSGGRARPRSRRPAPRALAERAFRRSAAARSSASSSRRRSRRLGATADGADGSLLLDEPTASLDLRYQLEIGALLRRLHDGSRHHDAALDARPALRGVGLHARSSCWRGGRVLGRGHAGGDAHAGAPWARSTTSIPSLPRRSLGDGGSFVTAMTAVPLRRGLPVVALGVRHARWSSTLVARRSSDRRRCTSARVFTRVGAVRRQRRRADLLLARLPRALAAALVGGTLAAAGVVFQGLLRNPLATPYTLGVSAGASLGAMVAITFGAAWPVGGVATASLAGALLAVLVVYALAQRAASRALDDGAAARRRDAERVLLGADPVRAVPQRLRRRRIARCAGSWAISTSPAIGRFSRRCRSSSSRSRRSRGWRGRSTCSASAPRRPATRGVNVVRAQRVAFFSASLATGAAVSVGGPIGFVGIIVPHLVRLVVGADHRLVLPASTLFGARVSRRVRRARAHRARADRAAGRHHHGADRRAVLSLVAHEDADDATHVDPIGSSLRAAGAAALACDAGRTARVGRAIRPRRRLRRRAGSSRSSRPSPRCCSRSAPATTSSACRATTTIRRRSRRGRRSARWSIRISSGSCRSSRTWWSSTARRTI